MITVLSYEQIVSLGRISQWLVKFEIDLTEQIRYELDELNDSLKNMNLPDHILNSDYPKFVYAGLNFGILTVTEF